MIRRAALSDLDRLLAIEQDSFDSDRISRRAMRRLLKRPSADIWVAECADEVAAYILILRHARRSTARIYSLATARAYAGQGLARNLLCYAERHCGAPAISLEVRRDNERAQKNYHAAGYQFNGERPEFYQDGQPALIMRKDLHLK